MGPFILADIVGLDVGYKVAKILENAYGERMKVAELIDQLYNNKKLLGKNLVLEFIFIKEAKLALIIV